MSAGPTRKLPPAPVRQPSYAVSVPFSTPFEEEEGNPFEKAGSIVTPDKNELSPLRAHYLKRELVTLRLVQELEEFLQPDALSVLGPPFAPAQPGTNVPTSVQARQARDVDLPFTRFLFHHFILSFPMLAKAQPSFFSDKLQPFVHSFLARNISTSDDREEMSKRRKITGKFEKHLGLILSAAIKMTDNGGKEEVIRISDYFDGQGNPLPQNPQAGKSLPPIPRSVIEKDMIFSVNVVTVRTIVVKGRLRNSSREEFLIRTVRKGYPDLYVSRRYGAFYKLAENLRKDYPEEDVRPPPGKDRRATEMRSPSSASGTATPTSATHHRLQSTGSDADSVHSLDLNSPGVPPTLSRERNRLTLRAYIRALLNNPTIAASGLIQEFLTADPTTPSSAEMKDIEQREENDRVREEETNRFRERSKRE